ncbi:MAG: ChbG/HpnK family deacetylase [Alcanivorax sp.]|nr:ChbG/HpnK family deacetylase [Alcanivorax sp.]
MRRLILCADDYGLSASVDGAIVDLLARQRLSATSCMVQGARWPDAAEALRPYLSTAQVGLHFNLTEGLHNDDLPLGQLLGRVASLRVDRRWVAQRLHEQLDLFETHLGRPPAYVDGHQHVHVFPGVRGVFLRVLAQRYPTQRPWLRFTAPLLSPGDQRIKAWVLSVLSVGFAAQAQRAGFTGNHGFAGLYSLSERADFAALMRDWCQRLPDKALIMCHPACGEAVAAVDHGLARQQEYDFLSSDHFSRLLSEQQIGLHPNE